MYISIDGLQDYHGKAGVAIILGNHVNGDGTLSPWLQGRVDKAIALYRAGQVEHIFASGGIGTKEDNYYPEADAMKNYMLAKGIPAAAITADNKGQNTYLTAVNFIAWNASHHYSNAIAVSQFYHITRIKYILHKKGFARVYSASSDRFHLSDLVGLLREVPALYKYMLKY
ncbi:MAG TPA: YdcF family protein [Chitinophagaceae bacterium]|nr:YdcF family protein [Chitinophagaceae bacterium]